MKRSKVMRKQGGYLAAGICFLFLLTGCGVKAEKTAEATALIEALDYFEKTRNVDVIIIGRGGGSIEDLWAFNNEMLAHAIYNMTIPVISAVGHEIDFTICDFVSDVRAPTPSAAAELAVPDTNDMLVRFSNVEKRLCTLLSKKLDSLALKYDMLKRSPVFTDAEYLTDQYAMRLDHSYERLVNSVNVKLLRFNSAFETSVARLDALSPLKIMSRGYTVASKLNGCVIKSIDEISVDDQLTLRLKDGSAECVVKSRNGGNIGGK